jgi:ribosomal-protein-alanine N-acetyltransferase
MNQPKLSLRKFKLTDLFNVLKVGQEAFPMDAWTERQFRFCYKHYPDGFVVVLINNRLVGFTVGWISPKWGGIGNMAVVKKFRRRGIGEVLVKHILEWLKRKKCEVCRIEVNVQNHEALSFFQKLGFKKIKKLSKFYPSGEDAFLMRKKL